MLFGYHRQRPSRSCLLTGTHSGHTAIRGNVELDPEGQFPLPADAQTIFHDFQNAGYKTGAFGKWGLGFIGSTGDPKKQGIDEFYGYNCQLLAHSYYPDHLWDNDKRVELKDNTLDVQYGKGTYSQDLIHSKDLTSSIGWEKAENRSACGIPPSSPTPN